MTDLIKQLRHEERIHANSGAHGLSLLFKSAADKITELDKTISDFAVCVTHIMDMNKEGVLCIGDSDYRSVVEKFAIEQQIKALEELLNGDSGYLQTEEGSFAFYDYEISGRIEQLRQQAEEE